VSKEELEILSDAIKIGFPILGTILGALIGAVSSFIVTRLKNNEEIKKDILARKLGIIEDVSEDFAVFTDVIAKLYAESKLQHETIINQGFAEDVVAKNIATIAQMLHDCQPRLKKMESRLLILGVHDACGALTDYLKEVEKFRDKIASIMSSEEFLEFYKSLGNLETKFYSELSKKYSIA
jgi:hypothetical protein